MLIEPGVESRPEEDEGDSEDADEARCDTPLDWPGLAL